MSWRNLQISPCNTHHLDPLGNPAYEERFDEVMKFHAPGMAPVRRGKEAWHIHANGSSAYTRRFGQTFGYYENRAAVIDLDGWCHIRGDGQDAYDERYTWCGNYQSGRCSVRESNGSYLHIDTGGRPAYTDRWRYAGDYRDGVAVVQANDGRSTHIDLAGHTVHDQWFFNLDVYHKCFARACDEAGWTHIGRTGVPAYTRRFSNVEPFYNGQARVERFDGGFEVIDESGATVVELRPAIRSEFAALSADMVGFWKTQTIAAAVDLGLIDALPGLSKVLAEHCQLLPDRTVRLLRALRELGLTTQIGQVWHLTSRGAYLRSDNPLTLADAAREYAGPFSQLWAELPKAVRADMAWKTPEIFHEVAQNKYRLKSHHRMLRSYARHDYPAVPAALGLGGTERLVDAGGGFGTMANLLLDTYPMLKVVVLDLPEVIKQAKDQYDNRKGLEWRSVDLFNPWGIEADAVVFARILHDWDDASCRQILRRARAVLPPGGKVFVIEMTIPEGGVAGSLCDLHLLMATGGQERTVAEYKRLLEAEGFDLHEIRNLLALPTVLVGVAR
jgi:ubiquinone/menaquinone biosynthesis C-methylase UbiE